jgi:pilus assembly protein Flp/PilA
MTATLRQTKGNSPMRILSRFVKDESGATAIEYGLIAVLIGVAIIAGATALGNALNTTFNDIAGEMVTTPAP